MNKYSEIIIQPFTTSLMKEERYLLSYRGQYYEAASPVVELLEELQKYTTEEEAISSYLHKQESKYTTDQIHHIIEKTITPLFSAQNEKTFLYEKELFKAPVIDYLSDTFRFLFNKVYMVVMFTILLVLDIYFFLTTNDLLLFSDKANVYLVAGLLLFMLFSSFFHELGHASACKYFGVRHGGIGFGLYLNLPVLYTDVTEVWKLNKGQRCVVNIAGVYFQSLLLIGLLLGFFLSRNDIFRYLILIMNLGFLMTLNPFFKFDGYWIVSDFLSVPNLRTRSKELISYCFKRICNRTVKEIPYLLQLRSVEKYGLLIYSIVVNVFMVFYFLYIIPVFLYQFIDTFPNAVKEIIFYLSNGMTPPFALLQNIGTQLIFLALIGYFIINSILSLKKRNVDR